MQPMPYVAVEEQRVLVLTCKRADKTFGEHVDYRVIAVLKIGEQLFSKSVEISECFFHLFIVCRMALCQHRIKLTPQADDCLLCLEIL